MSQSPYIDFFTCLIYHNFNIILSQEVLIMIGLLIGLIGLVVVVVAVVIIVRMI